MRRGVNARAGIGALLVIGLAFGGFGYLGLTAPEVLMAPVGLTWATLSATTQNELTATYGGMNLAMGVFFVIAAFVPAIRAGALLTATALLGGLAAGRIYSLVRLGVPGPMPLAALVVELLGLLLALGALLKRRPAEPPPRKPLSTSTASPASPPAAPSPAPPRTP